MDRIITPKKHLQHWKYLWSCLLLFMGSQGFLPVIALSNQVPQHSKQFIETQRVCSQALKTKIETILSDQKLQRSHWGISIQNLENGATLYDLNAHKYFIPASNAKLLVTAAALIKFGAEFQWETPIYGEGTGTNLSRLKVVGQGDPTLKTEDVEKLAKDLNRQGIRRIQTLIVEDNQVNLTPINPTWEWEDIQFYYGTAVNRLILNENAVTLTLIPQKMDEPLQLEWSDNLAGEQWQINNQTITAAKNTPYAIEIKRTFGKPLLTLTGQLAIDSQPDTFGLTIIDPANYFLSSLKNALEKEGIQVNNTQIMIDHQNNNELQKIASIKSETLEEIIKKANQDSNNLYAESLLNLLADNLASSLTTIGINEEGYSLKDGSGLSRHNLITPNTLVTLLRLMANTEEGSIYRNSLAMSGVSGTLKNRLKNTVLEGKIQAKTGTLSGTSTLSGYLNPPNYPSLVFSIMVNQSPLPASDLREIIDRILLTLGQLQPC